jgi:hypothetical protein
MPSEPDGVVGANSTDGTWVARFSEHNPTAILILE